MLNKKLLTISMCVILVGGAWYLLSQDQVDQVSKSFWRNQEVWDYSKVMPMRAQIFEKFIQEQIIPTLSKSDIVGELGSASGEYTLKVAPYAKKIEAFEISKKMVDSAKKLAENQNIKNVVFNCSSAEEVTLEPNVYDKFLCLGLFTCIPSDKSVKKIINNMYTSLKPGGVLFIKDSVTSGGTVKHNDGNYAAIYRNEKEYFDCFSDKFDIEYKSYIADNGNYKSVVAVLRRKS